MFPLPQKINLAEVKMMKYRSYVAIGWGLVVIVCLMAIFRGHPMAIEASMLVAVIWTLSRMVRDATDGVMFLRALKKADEEVKTEED